MGEGVCRTVFNPSPALEQKNLIFKVVPIGKRQGERERGLGGGITKTIPSNK